MRHKLRREDKWIDRRLCIDRKNVRWSMRWHRPRSNKVTWIDRHWTGNQGDLLLAHTLLERRMASSQNSCGDALGTPREYTPWTRWVFSHRWKQARSTYAEGPWDWEKAMASSEFRFEKISIHLWVNEILCDAHGSLNEGPRVLKKDRWVRSNGSGKQRELASFTALVFEEIFSEILGKLMIINC